jgi:glutathione S-transferase
MSYLHIVIVAAIGQYLWFGWEVGRLRGVHKVRAPAITGPVEFERAFRAHQNTLEQLVVLIPALLLFAQYFDPRWAAGLGALHVVGRALYRRAYLLDPSRRTVGFVMGYSALGMALLGVLYGAVATLF